MGVFCLAIYAPTKTKIKVDHSIWGVYQQSGGVSGGRVCFWRATPSSLEASNNAVCCNNWVPLLKCLEKLACYAVQLWDAVEVSHTFDIIFKFASSKK